MSEDESSSQEAVSKTARKVSPRRPLQNGIVKKRVRSPKTKSAIAAEDVPMKQTKVTDTMKKVKRTVDRFNGVTKEELITRVLPDRIKHGLDILFVGINPGLFAVFKGHHYAGPGNHFWKCVNMSGLVDHPATSENDVELLDCGIGFSTVVQRTTPSAKDLTSKEIREGGNALIEKIKTYQPKIVVFNGKGIYEVFSKEVFNQKKKDFTFGKQANTIPGTNTRIYVMPSTSARCSQFPRAQDKVQFFIQIKSLRDEIRGFRTDADVIETNYTFDLQKATEIVCLEKVKQEKHDPSYDNGQQVCPTSSTTVPAAPHSSPNSSSPSDLAGHSNTPPTSKGILSSRKRPVGCKAANQHPNLVKFLCRKEDPQMPASSLPQKPTMPRLQEVVSEEQRNERVGMWVRTQINQDYESEPPMGYEELYRAVDIPEQQESDHESQQSMVSAGVSGSTSTGSTSGYGSLDNNPHNARQDRVEMWVREQQYVSRMNSVSDLRRSQQEQQLRNGEAEQNPQVEVAGPSYNAWNNFSVQQVAFPGASHSADGALRPPVPLFSTWGGNEARRFPGLAASMNDNTNVIRKLAQPQININSFVP